MALLETLAIPAVARLGRQLFGSGKSAAEKEAERRRTEREKLLSGYADRWQQRQEDYWRRQDDAERSLDGEIRKYADELNAPTTAQDDAAVNRASEGIAQDAERARARLTTSLSRAGVADSASRVGGETALASAEAGNLARVRDSVAERSLQRRELRRQRLIDLLARRFTQSAGMAGQAGGSALGALSGAESSDRFTTSLARQDGMYNDSGLGMLAEELGRVLAARRRRDRPMTDDDPTAAWNDPTLAYPREAR